MLIINQLLNNIECIEGKAERSILLIVDIFSIGADWKQVNCSQIVVNVGTVNETVYFAPKKL